MYLTMAYVVVSNLALKGKSRKPLFACTFISSEQSASVPSLKGCSLSNPTYMPTHAPSKIPVLLLLEPDWEPLDSGRVLLVSMDQIYQPGNTGKVTHSMDVLQNFTSCTVII